MGQDIIVPGPSSAPIRRYSALGLLPNRQQRFSDTRIFGYLDEGMGSLKDTRGCDRAPATSLPFASPSGREFLRAPHAPFRLPRSRLFLIRAVRSNTKYELLRALTRLTSD